MAFAIAGREAQVHGNIFIIKDRCKECGFCIEFCPEGVLQKSEEFNSKGYHPPNLVETEKNKCIACGFCSMICPDFAIFVEKEEKEENERQN